MSSKQYLNPAGIAAPTGYTHVVTTDAKKLVFISGQVGMDASGKTEEGLRAQTVQVFENLKTALAAVGATFDDVVKLTTLIVNYKPEDRVTIREVRAQYLSAAQPPASTLIGVQGLAVADWLIEIEAIAAVE